jgi:hypothetical protein
VNGNVWKLGDIINSTPKVFAGTPLNTYHVDYSDRTYYDYLLTDAYKRKSSVAFVGANDGMLHAFRIAAQGHRTGGNHKGIVQNFFGRETRPYNSGMRCERTSRSILHLPEISCRPGLLPYLL